MGLQRPCRPYCRHSAAKLRARYARTRNSWMGWSSRNDEASSTITWAVSRVSVMAPAAATGAQRPGASRKRVIRSDNPSQAIAIPRSCTILNGVVAYGARSTSHHHDETVSGSHKMSPCVLWGHWGC